MFLVCRCGNKLQYDDPDYCKECMKVSNEIIEEYEQLDKEKREKND